MYRPKFCCECGERILREKWKPWTSRRYCDNCAKQFQKKQIIAPALAGVALLSGGLLAGRSLQPQQPAIIERGTLAPLTSTPSKQQNANNQTQTNSNNQMNTNTTQAQNNINADPAQTPIVPEEPAYYCGARTQKGTPCMRRVRGPIRCWQHEGKPPMLAQEKLLIREN